MQQSLIDSVLRLLYVSWEPIGFDYDYLTDTERSVLSPEEYEKLATLVKGVDRYRYFTSAQLWETFVGEQGVGDFLGAAKASVGNIVNDYVAHSPMCSDLSAPERVTVARGLVLHCYRWMGS